MSLPTRAFGKPPRPLDRTSMRVALAFALSEPAQVPSNPAAFGHAYAAWATAVSRVADTLYLARPAYDPTWRARFCYFAGMHSHRPGTPGYAETGGTEERLTEMEALRLGHYWPHGQDERP